MKNTKGSQSLQQHVQNRQNATHKNTKANTVEKKNWTKFAYVNRQIRRVPSVFKTPASKSQKIKKYAK
jgi:hypothetical protein